MFLSTHGHRYINSKDLKRIIKILKYNPGNTCPSSLVAGEVHDACMNKDAAPRSHPITEANSTRLRFSCRFFCMKPRTRAAHARSGARRTLRTQGCVRVRLFRWFLQLKCSLKAAQIKSLIFFFILSFQSCRVCFCRSFHPFLFFLCASYWRDILQRINNDFINVPPIATLQIGKHEKA